MNFSTILIVLYFKYTDENYWLQKESDARVAKVLSAGIEPATLGLLDPRSDQLSYASYVIRENLSKTIRSTYIKQCIYNACTLLYIL